MALPSDYITGTITLTNGEVEFTGTGTAWKHADFREGDIIFDLVGGDNRIAVIATIASDTEGTLTKAWEGPTLTDVAYRMRYHLDSGRVSAQARAMIEALGNGNLEAFAALLGPGVPVFNGPHSLTIRAESDFVNGVEFNAQVDDLAARAQYDTVEPPFRVLVNDMGDGRAALFSKISATSGDWSDPAYITGPPGPIPVIEADVVTIAPGLPAEVVVTPIAGGYNLEFDLPAAEGMQPRGPWSAAETYAKGDVVSRLGSSWVAKRINTNVQPVEGLDWGLLAQKGTDGSGSGDVSGPAGATTDYVALFADNTGKALKNGFAVTTFAKTFLDDADATAVRLTIGANDAANLNTGTLPDARVSATLGADKAYRRGNIVGTVSASGGIPTGALFQLISNANGIAMRFADGTQICWRSNMPLTNTTNSDSKTGTWTFPAAFIDQNTVIVHNPDAGSSWNDDQGIYRGQSETVEQVTVTNCRVIIGRQTGLWDATKTVTTRIVAIGRWV